MKLIAATHNKGKLKELSEVLSGKAEIIPISVFTSIEPEETGATLEENAVIKAKYAFSVTGHPSFADDSGLFVDALSGEPGIHSSRFAPTDEERVKKLLEKLKNVPDSLRTAYFGCAVAYCDGKNDFVVTGKCFGRIIREKRGRSGFGYDPVFVPDGFGVTFAELPGEVKNKISHRAKALELFRKELLKKGLLKE